MKKLYALMTMALSMLLVFGMVGCGKNEAPAKDEMTVDQLYEQGYAMSMSSMTGDEGTWKAYYTKDGDWTIPYLVEIPMTQAEVDEILNAPTDEDAHKIISSKKNIKVTDMSDKVPSQDKMDEYVGKKLSDFEADDYYVSSASDFDGNVSAEICKNGEYIIQVTFNEPITFDEFEEAVDHSGLTIKEAKFAGFADEY